MMRLRDSCSKGSLAVLVVAGLSSVLLARTAPQKTAAAAKASAPAPARDLTGIWSFIPGDPALSPVGSLTGVGRGPGDMPPFTAWGQARYDANKPGYGPKMTGQGNDPALQCDPQGIPRLLFGATFELVTLPGKTIQLFATAWRPIYTDGRKLPDDPDPDWMGTSVGHWEGDHTFVVNSVGFNDRTWLGQEGQPHSDEMKLEERWERVNKDTLTLNATIDDPKTYTKAYKTIQINYRLRPASYEFTPSPCVWSDENNFTNRIRKPAVAPAK
jgi:hypothetical protein